MNGPVRNDDEAGMRLMGTIFVFVLLLAALLVAMGPEPALHQERPVTPATSADVVPFGGGR